MLKVLITQWERSYSYTPTCRRPLHSKSSGRPALQVSVSSFPILQSTSSVLSCRHLPLARRNPQLFRRFTGNLNIVVNHIRPFWTRLWGGAGAGDMQVSKSDSGISRFQEFIETVKRYLLWKIDCKKTSPQTRQTRVAQRGVFGHDAGLCKSRISSPLVGFGILALRSGWRNQ